MCCVLAVWSCTASQMELYGIAMQHAQSNQQCFASAQVQGCPPPALGHPGVRPGVHHAPLDLLHPATAHCQPSAQSPAIPLPATVHSPQLPQFPPHLSHHQQQRLPLSPSSPPALPPHPVSAVAPIIPRPLPPQTPLLHAQPLRSHSSVILPVAAPLYRSGSSGFLGLSQLHGRPESPRSPYRLTRTSHMLPPPLTPVIQPAQPKVPRQENINRRSIQREESGVMESMLAIMREQQARERRRLAKAFPHHIGPFHIRGHLDPVIPRWILLHDPIRLCPGCKSSPV